MVAWSDGRGALDQTKSSNTVMIGAILLIIGVTLASNRNPNQPMGGPKNIIQISSPTDFCMFLPPNQGQSIASSEGYPLASPEEVATWAVSFCTTANPNAPGARLFPKGLLTGAHFQQTDTYVQITGTWNANILSIPLDGGG